MTFDPFGDFATRGYLRNIAAEKDPDRVKILEYHSFNRQIRDALKDLRGRSELGYRDILATHQRLFANVYPWAGRDRLALAPNLVIGRGNRFDLFAHPNDIRRAAERALAMARDSGTMQGRPGEIFGLLAHAHPFLEGNGRTLMTIHTELSRRAGIHIDWPSIGKQEFLAALTRELDQPGKALDQLLAPHVRTGALDLGKSAAILKSIPGLN